MTAADLSDDNLALLEAKLKADLETVQKVRALMREHLGSRVGTAVQVSPAAQGPVEPAQPVVSQREAIERIAQSVPRDVKTEVRQVLEGLPETFKIGAVKQGLKERRADFPDTSIRSVLMRMVQMGELTVDSYATGRGGNVFRQPKKETSPGPDQNKEGAV